MTSSPKRLLDWELSHPLASPPLMAVTPSPPTLLHHPARAVPLYATRKMELKARDCKLQIWRQTRETVTKIVRGR